MDDIAREFTDLLGRARRGCPESARLLYDRYNRAVRRVVRRWLHHRLRRHYDSADFAQSVWASFFALPPDGEFSGPAALVAFLSKVAYNKVVETSRRRLGTLRYDLAREVSLEDTPAGSADKPDFVAPTPTPSQNAQADERWQRLLAGLSPGYRRALELLRDGHTHSEIADRLGVDRRSIRRLLDRLQRRLD